MESPQSETIQDQEHWPYSSHPTCSSPSSHLAHPGDVLLSSNLLGIVAQGREPSPVACPGSCVLLTVTIIPFPSQTYSPRLTQQGAHSETVVFLEDQEEGIGVWCPRAHGVHAGLIASNASFLYGDLVGTRTPGHRQT